MKQYVKYITSSISIVGLFYVLLLPLSTYANTEANIKKIVSQGVPEKVLKTALKAYKKADANNKIRKKGIIAIADYNQPSNSERFWVIDLNNSKIVYNSYVSHGKNSGRGKYATNFSNVNNSKQSSLGGYVTDNTYYGKNGYSLRLDGLEKGVNSNARSRYIVVHGANYASPSYVKRNNRAGNSWGCFALPKKDTKRVINLIRDGAFLFAYNNKLDTSKYS